MVRCVSKKFFKARKLQQINVRMSVPPQQSFFNMVKKSSICCRNTCTVIRTENSSSSSIIIIICLRTVKIFRHSRPTVSQASQISILTFFFVKSPHFILLQLLYVTKYTAIYAQRLICLLDL